MLKNHSGRFLIPLNNITTLSGKYSAQKGTILKPTVSLMTIKIISEIYRLLGFPMRRERLLSILSQDEGFKALFQKQKGKL